MLVQCLANTDPTFGQRLVHLPDLYSGSLSIQLLSQLLRFFSLSQIFEINKIEPNLVPDCLSLVLFTCLAHRSL